MSIYEMTVLLQKEEDLKEVHKLLKEHNGNITEEQRWGKRDLAYPIQKHTAAYYITLWIEIDQSQVLPLRQKMNFQEKILRFLLLKVDPKSISKKQKEPTPHSNQPQTEESEEQA